MSDIRAENYGSIWLLRPLTEAGLRWVEENIPDDAQTWAGAIVVEPRYVEAIVKGARDDGLEIA